LAAALRQQKPFARAVPAFFVEQQDGTAVFTAVMLVSTGGAYAMQPGEVIMR